MAEIENLVSYDNRVWKIIYCEDIRNMVYVYTLMCVKTGERVKVFANDFSKIGTIDYMRYMRKNE